MCIITTIRHSRQFLISYWVIQEQKAIGTNRSGRGIQCLGSSFLVCMKSPFTQGQKPGPSQSIATGGREKYAEVSWTVERKKRTGAGKKERKIQKYWLKKKREKENLEAVEFGFYYEWTKKKNNSQNPKNQHQMKQFHFVLKCNTLNVLETHPSRQLQ